MRIEALVRVGLLVLLAVPATGMTAEALTRSAILLINAEINSAWAEGHFKTVERFYAPDARIVVDLDPAPGSGSAEMNVDGLVKMTETSMALMQAPSIHDEVLRLDIGPAGKRAVLETRTTATMTMMGMRLQDVSRSRTTFGLVDGAIRILSQEDEILSSGPAP